MRELTGRLGRVAVVVAALAGLSCGEDASDAPLLDPTCVAEGDKTCGQTWRCATGLYEFNIEMHKSIIYDDVSVQYRCESISIGGSREEQRWNELLKDRSQASLCAQARQTQANPVLLRVARLCGWPIVSEDKSATGCSAPAKEYWVNGKYSDGGGSIAWTYTIPVTLPAEQLTCGSHRYRFSRTYVHTDTSQTQCLGEHILRFDAHKTGLAYGSLHVATTCLMPGWWGLYYVDFADR